MTEIAAHRVDHLIPGVPVRQWVLSFPTPLCYLFAAHRQLLSPVLRVVNRAASTFLIKQPGLKHPQATIGTLLDPQERAFILPGDVRVGNY
jgi:hypothetical protein